MADETPGNKPNRPLRPRQGAPRGRRKRRVVIDNAAGRPRIDPRQLRDRGVVRREARPGAGSADRSGHRRLGIVRQGHLAGARRHDGGDHQDPDGARRPEDGDADAVRRGGRAARYRAEARGDDQARGRRGARAGGVRGRRGGPRRPAARRDDHGSRRPRQDDAARCDPRDLGRRDGGRRYHAAHRRLPGRPRRSSDHVPRHAGPRGVHRHARPRSEGDGHRRARRRRRRRRHAADEGVDLARSRRRGADRRRRQQGRPSRRERRPRQERACSRGPPARGLGRSDAVLGGVREGQAEPRRPPREGAARRGRRARAAREPEGRGIGPDHRVPPRRRPRTRRHAPRPPRDAAGR